MTNFESMSFLNYIRLSKVKILSLLFSVLTFATLAADIKGKIVIDESWEPVIYLSAINSFDDFNTAAYDFLVYQTSIDSLGNFEMKDLILPEGDRIYRLHICKKNDPVSTIIIGGKDENFIHFLMNNQSVIVIHTDGEKPFFQNNIVQGNDANNNLFLLLNLQKELLTPPTLPSKQNREFQKEKIINKYMDVADTSSHTITKLLALHLINESAESPQIELMEKTGQELHISDSSNPYYLKFLDQLKYLRYQSGQSIFPSSSWLKWTGLILLLIFIGLIIFNRKGRKKESMLPVNSNLIQELSVQEKKVFDLIRTGASNKEISSELNIEVSTVKSHVYKIFTRLGIKSRKEIVNKDW
jgi:DNA-binding CsgD family transcriptional regulator